MKEENGPLIALVAFVLLSGLFGAKAYFDHREWLGDAQDPEKEIRDCKEQIVDLQSKIQTCTQNIVKLKAGVREQNARYSFYSGQYDEFTNEYQRRLSLLKVANEFDKQASTLQEEVSALKQKTLAAINKESGEVRDVMERDVQDLQTKKDTAVSHKSQITSEFELTKKRYQQNKNYTQTELDNSKSILEDLTQRDIERAKVLTQPDGKVILADPTTNLAVIDIGTSVGVKNGFRFECYASKPGGQKVTKGYLQVVRAEPSQSQCLVVRQPVYLPRDPLSQYVAKDPEEMYSPYHESGHKGSSAQQLSGNPIAALSGPSEMQPIVEGDLIENPLFSPGKSYTYYIAGAKKIENDRQKSAIRFRWPEIKAVIEFYGGKVSTVADPSVDFMIMQKNPESDGEDSERAEFKKAKELGLPVIYEWELFRFLDNK